MASNDINACASRISQHFHTYNAIKSDIQDLPLNRIFSGDGLAELRERFELERDLAISDDGQLAGANPNALTLPSRQTRAQARAAVRRPLTEISANIVLDTPAPKRPRLNAPEIVPPTPAAIPANAFSLPEPPSMGPRRSSRVSAIPKVNYFNDLADVDRDSEHSPDDVEPEGSSDND
ncbi:hypothetical protein LI328DRAFT_163832, partial [Trichoderma asperelloides]